MGSATLEVIFKAIDQYSSVVDKLDTKNKNFSDGLQKAYRSAAVAITGAGVAIEGLARQQQDLSVATAQLAKDVGMSTDQVRDLATSLSSASVPLDNVLQLMDLGQKQGVTSAEGLRKYAEFWSMVGTATGESAPALAEAAVGLRALGIDAENSADAEEALAYITDKTTISAGDFLSTVSKLAPQLKASGMSVNDVAVYLGVLESRGITGKAAIGALNAGMKESADKGISLGQALGITTAEAQKFESKMKESADSLRADAEIVRDAKTPLQELQATLGDVVYSFGDTIAAAADFAPALMVIGPAVGLFGELHTAVAVAGGVMPLLSGGIAGVGGAIMTCMPYIAAIGLAIAALYLIWTNNLFGIQEKTASFVDYIGDRFKGVTDALEPVGKKLGEWGEKLGDHFSKAFGKLDSLVKKLTGGSGIFDILGKAIEIFGRVWDKEWDMIGQALTIAVDIICGAIDGIVSVIETLIDWFDKIADHPVVKFFTNLFAGAVKVAGGALDALLGPTEDTAEAFDEMEESADKAAKAVKRQADEAAKAEAIIKQQSGTLEEIAESYTNAGDRSEALTDAISAQINTWDSSGASMEYYENQLMDLGYTAEEAAAMVAKASADADKAWATSPTKTVSISLPDGSSLNAQNLSDYMRDALAAGGPVTPEGQAQQAAGIASWKQEADLKAKGIPQSAAEDHVKLTSNAGVEIDADYVVYNAEGQPTKALDITDQGYTVWDYKTQTGPVSEGGGRKDWIISEANYGSPGAAWNSFESWSNPWVTASGKTPDSEHYIPPPNYGPGSKNWKETSEESVRATENIGTAIDENAEKTGSAAKKIESASKSLEVSGTKIATTHVTAGDRASSAAEVMRQNVTGRFSSMKETASAESETMNGSVSGSMNRMRVTSAAEASTMVDTIKAKFAEMTAAAQAVDVSAAAAGGSTPSPFGQGGGKSTGSGSSSGGSTPSGNGYYSRTTGAWISTETGFRSHAYDQAKDLLMCDKGWGKAFSGAAEGGDVAGSGVLVVGEKGPEIVNLPKGAKVTPLSGKGDPINYDRLAGAIGKALGSKGGAGKEVHLHIGTFVGDQAGLRKLQRLLEGIQINEGARKGVSV